MFEVYSLIATPTCLSQRCGHVQIHVHMRVQMRVQTRVQMLHLTTAQNYSSCLVPVTVFLSAIWFDDACA